MVLPGADDDDLKAIGNEPFTCILCQLNLTNRKELVRLHFLNRHGVELPGARRVHDIAGLLNCLQQIIFRSDACEGSSVSPSTLSWHCPVCEKATGTNCAALELHIGATQHHRWNRHTIEPLAAFYFDRDEGASSDTEGDDDERNPICDGNEAESDEEGEWDDDVPMKCLYCDDEGVDCLSHMVEKHQFDLKATTSHRDDIKDEYDLIRLVNETRRAIDAGHCPYHCCGGSASSGGTEDDAARTSEEGPHSSSMENENADVACTNDIQSRDGNVEAHLAAHPTHRLPQHVPSNDSALIPFLPGDALLSYLVTTGEGFLPQETADPDFPMVPTMLQLAERRRAQQQQQQQNQKQKQ